MHSVYWTHRWCRNVIIFGWLFFAAWCSGVHPWWSFNSITVWSPLSRSSSIISTDLCWAAVCTGVSSLLFVAIILAPWSTNSCTTAVFSPSQARCKGVFPFASVTSSKFVSVTALKFWIWIFTTSICPCWQAVCSGVLPSLSLHSMSWGLWPIRCCTTLRQKVNLVTNYKL